MSTEIKKNQEFTKLIIFSLIIMGGVATLIVLPRLAVPFILSYVIYLITNPLIPKLKKYGCHETLAVSCIVLGFVFFTVYPVIKVVPLISREAQNIQFTIPKIENYVTLKNQELQRFVKKKVGFDMEESTIQGYITNSKSQLSSFVLTLPTLLASAVEWFFVTPFFLFFLLRDGGKFKKILLSLAPNSIFERFYQLSYEFNRQIGGYIFAKLIEATIVGLIITIGLSLMGVRFSLILGFIAAITNIIPYVGPLLGAIPAIIFALVEYDVTTPFWAILILYFVANAIDIALVFPILVSKIVNLHPLLVVVSVIIGSQSMGVVGMVVSIPLAAALKLLFLEVYAIVYTGPRS